MLFLISEQIYKLNKNHEIDKLIKELRLEKKIKIIDINSYYDLICLCKLSKLFIFPLKFTKLNIKYLNLIVSKVPTLLPDNQKLRQLTKNEYIYYNGFDPLSLADKITYILSNRSSQKKIQNFDKKLN